MNSPTVYADFHNADARGRVRLNCTGTVADLARLGVVLTDGLRLTLSDDERAVVGQVTFSTDEQLWVAAVDGAAVRPVPADGVPHPS